MVIGGGIIGYINWSNRYRWPRHPVSSLQDSPPLDRSHWPKAPEWSNQTVMVEVATPDGLKMTNITYYINSLDMKFVRVEPGTFWEGLTKEQALRMKGEHKYGHQVTLTKPYYLAAYETTIRLFEQYDPTFVSRRVPYKRGKGFEDHPAIGVTWRECQQFCRWLSEK
jgi:formylglycine-generating enzyme required for sulfatase activity